MHRIILLVLIFPIIISCEDNVESNNQFSLDPCEISAPTPDSLRYTPKYDKPIVTFPNITENNIFYSGETVPIQWELPSDLWNTEFQILEFDSPFECTDLENFHLLNNNPMGGYGNQFMHYYQTNPINVEITDTLYVAYRLRSADIESRKGYSLWKDVQSFTMVPLLDLDKKEIKVSYNFKFTTEELNEFYYSGTIKKNNYRLEQVALDQNLDFDKIKFVRPTKFETTFVTKFDNGRNPFERIIIGFDEDVSDNYIGAYPFEPLADVYPGSYEESPVNGDIYQYYPSNLMDMLVNYDLKFAYKLTDDIGTEHEIKIDLILEVFSNKI